MGCSRLWIDVTDLVVWRQRKTGTQRVIHEVIAAYSAIREVSLFYFSQRMSMFFEVDPAEFLARAARAEESDEIGVPDRPTSVRSLVQLKARRAAFCRTDQLLILGGDWRRRGFLKKLAGLRFTIGVRVHHFVHDVMPITMPQLFPEHETVSCLDYLTQAFRIADSVITSSQWNVSQIATLISTGVLPDLPVHAVGLGSTSLVAVSPRLPSIDLPARFVLSVGTLELKKN
jgi:hypothetical protein